MMCLDMPETCRGWRNILRISFAAGWFFFTRRLSNLTFFRPVVCIPRSLHLSILPAWCINLLTRNVNYSGRTAPLTSKVAFYIFIQQI